MSVSLECEPGKLAQFLQVALAQRKRTLSKFNIDFGADSPAALAVAEEVNAIQTLVTQCVKLAAKSPRIQR